MDSMLAWCFGLLLVWGVICFAVLFAAKQLGFIPTAVDLSKKIFRLWGTGKSHISDIGALVLLFLLRGGTFNAAYLGVVAAGFTALVAICVDVDIELLRIIRAMLLDLYRFLERIF